MYSRSYSHLPAIHKGTRYQTIEGRGFSSKPSSKVAPTCNLVWTGGNCTECSIPPCNMGAFLTVVETPPSYGTEPGEGWEKLSCPQQQAPAVPRKNMKLHMKIRRRVIISISSDCSE